MDSSANILVLNYVFVRSWHIIPDRWCVYLGVVHHKSLSIVDSLYVISGVHRSKIGFVAKRVDLRVELYVVIEPVFRRF